MPLYKFKCTNDKCNHIKEHMLSFNAFEDYKQKKLLIILKFKMAFTRGTENE